MSVYPGQHVIEVFLVATVGAVVLEVGDGEVKVQERDTRRAAWVPGARIG